MEELLNLNERARDAYRAYAKSTGGKNFQGQTMPGWDDLPPHITRAWMEATKAIIEAAVLTLGRMQLRTSNDDGFLSDSEAFARRSADMLSRDRVVIAVDPNRKGQGGPPAWLRSVDQMSITTNAAERLEFATEEQARNNLYRYRALGGTMDLYVTSVVDPSSNEQA